MAYDIHGDKGQFIAGGPSIGGLRDFKASFAKVSNRRYPYIAAFLNDGYSVSPQELGAELMAFSKNLKSSSVKFTCVELAKASMLCKIIVILHNSTAS